MPQNEWFTRSDFTRKVVARQEVGQLTFRDFQSFNRHLIPREINMMKCKRGDTDVAPYWLFS